MYCNDKGETVYVIVPESKTTIRMMNLSVSNGMSDIRKIGSNYIVETPTPVDNCFMDFPILSRCEAVEYVQQSESQEGGIWSMVAGWITKLLGGE